MKVSGKITAKFISNGAEDPLLVTVYLKRAREVFERAQKVAAELVKSSRAKLAKKSRKLRSKSRAAGFKNGEAAGREELHRRLIELQRRHQESLKKAELDCLELAVGVASEVLGAELMARRSTLASRIKRSLEELVNDKAMRVVVAPGWLEEVLEALRRLAPDAPISITEDETIKPGNARLETVSGSIELNWEEHLSLLKKHLRSRLEESLQSSQKANLGKKVAIPNLEESLRCSN